MQEEYMRYHELKSELQKIFLQLKEIRIDPQEMTAAQEKFDQCKREGVRLLRIPEASRSLKEKNALIAMAQAQQELKRLQAALKNLYI